MTKLEMIKPKISEKFLMIEKTDIILEISDQTHIKKSEKHSRKKLVVA